MAYDPAIGGYAMLGGDGLVLPSQLPVGGSVSISQTTINFGSVGVGFASFTITNAAVTPTSKIMIQVAGQSDTMENPGDDDPLMFSAVPGTGSFTLRATPVLGLVRGVFLINYQVAS